MAALVLFSSAVAAPAASVTTTVFVGRHFEARDHDQPTKYVFNGETRVAEITGSLSSNARVQRLRLYPGWNLCSLAVGGPFPASGGDAISAAFQWNPGTGGYSQVTPGQSFSGGTVLWAKAGTNAVVSVRGSYADPVPNQLPAGGAYVPGTGLEAWSPALPDSASSWFFNAAMVQWAEHLPGALAVISGPPPILSPSEGFYLQTAAPASLAPPDPRLRLRYYHQDHLGSSSIITDASGALVEETAFRPFGVSHNQYQPRNLHDPYEFTQKERDRESGLHYFEARYLAGWLSRLVTPDGKYAVPDSLSKEESTTFLDQPQQINLYTYVRSNPIRYTDPSGLDPPPDPAREQQTERTAAAVRTVVKKVEDKVGAEMDAFIGRQMATAGVRVLLDLAETAENAFSSDAPKRPASRRIEVDRDLLVRVQATLKLYSLVVKNQQRKIGKLEKRWEYAALLGYLAVMKEQAVIKEQQKEIERLKTENAALKGAQRHYEPDVPSQLDLGAE